MNMKNMTPQIAALSFLLLTACGTKENEAAPAENAADTSMVLTQEQFDTNGYALGKLEQRSFHQVVVSSGVLDVPPENRAQITAVMGGHVKKAPLLVGDRVKKGQQLLVLESREFLQLQQEYLEVHNQLDFLRSEFERNRTLFQENITSQKNFLDAQSKYGTYKATHQGLAAQLRMLNISPESVEQGKLVSQITLYAPIDGLVSKTYISLGSHVSPDSQIMEIVNNQEMHLELKVFEKDILQIRQGQGIRFKVPGSSREQFTGRVHLVGAAIDQEDRSILIHGHLDKEDNRLIPGMFVEAMIMTDSTQGWALPEEAVISSQSGSHVLRLLSKDSGGYTFDRVPVQTGPVFEGYTEILSDQGLEGDPEFLVKGAFDLIGG